MQDEMDTGKYKAWGGGGTAAVPNPGLKSRGPPGQYRPAESRLNAIAVPMTSCMSEPTMASSMVSQRMVRGS